MKSLTMFLQYILDDMGMWCRTSTTQDLKTILRRVEHEGLSFLTITLPNFGKDFQKSLDQGFVAHDQFSGFHFSGGLPRFLGGFLESVFDRKSGRLLDEPSIAAIQAIRQITLFLGKINLPCSDERIKAAFDGYIECEKEIRKADERADPIRILRFCRLSSLLWADVFTEVDRRIWSVPSEIIPKHGPGATQDRLRGNAKWVQTEWTERLDRVFPHQEHLVTSWRQINCLADVRFLEPGAERPVRVITVPKTLKSPRIIAVEPTCMQYMQQGLLDAFRDAVEGFDTPRQLVGWSSQVPNQHLAYKGSRDGTLATLDLSEASDRVSNQLVRLMLANHGLLSEAVDACRSRKADVPGYGVIRLAKFASMGSALCFPFESMVFMTLIFVGIEEELNRPMSKKDIKSLLGKVRVFGDDIIIPKEYVPSVIRILEDFGLRVNRDKSFWTGKFRESCGKDFYDGHDVSIVRVRTVLPSSLRDAQEIVSTVSLRNHLYQAGCWKTAAWLDTVIEGILPFPRVSGQSPVLGRISFLGPDLGGKLDDDSHQPLVKGGRIIVRIPSSRLENEGALLKCLTQLSLKSDGSDVEYGVTVSQLDSLLDIWSLPTPDAKHLERSGRPLSVDIKIGRGPAV